MITTAAIGVGAIATVLAALGAYLAVARRLSGKIGTSEAESLWAESKSIREDYRGQLLEANRRTLSLEARAAKLEHDNNLLARENIELSARLRESTPLVDELRARIDALELENTGLKEQVSELAAALRNRQEEDA